MLWQWFKWFAVSKMATLLLRYFGGGAKRAKIPPIFCRTLRGKPPGLAKSLDELTAYLNKVDPDISKPVNIGYSIDKDSNKDVRLQRLQCMKERNSKLLEKDARLRQLVISLEDVQAEYDATSVHQLRTIAEHYGIFQDLFHPYAYFMPVIAMKITYDYDNEFVSVVHSGNHMKPSETAAVPHVHFKAAPNSLWTLLLVNVDGHLADQSAEYLHWFIGNIPNGEVDKGELVCEYMQPLPPRGTGFHRLVFILYKQEEIIDYSSLKRTSPCLRERTFRNADFYRKYEDTLTPVGLAFFQCEWDETVSEFFHKTLDMREPIYEYEHRMPYIKPQTCYPHKEPFNLYLERYRDPKAIKKEIFLKRMKTVHPFKPDSPLPKYPLAYPVSPDLNLWKKTEMRKERLRIGKYRDLDIRDVFNAQ